MLILLLSGLVSLSNGATPDEVCRNIYGESSTASIQFDTPCKFTCAGFSREFTVDSGTHCNLTNSQNFQPTPEDGRFQEGFCFSRQCMSRERYEEETSGRRRDERQRNDENDDRGRRREGDRFDDDGGRRGGDGGRRTSDNGRNSDTGGRRGGFFFDFIPDMFQKKMNMFENMFESTADMASGFLEGATGMLTGEGGKDGRRNNGGGGTGRSSGIGSGGTGGKDNGIGSVVA